MSMSQKYNEFIFPISKREQICDKPSDTRLWVSILVLLIIGIGRRKNRL